MKILVFPKQFILEDEICGTVTVRPSRKARYWIHLTYNIHSDNALLAAYDNSQSYSRGRHELNCRRICVSPTMTQCVSAVTMWGISRGKFSHVAVYATTQPLRAYKAPEKCDVADAGITGEHWLVEDTDFRLLGGMTDRFFRSLARNGNNEYDFFMPGDYSRLKFQQQLLNLFKTRLRRCGLAMLARELTKEEVEAMWEHPFYLDCNEDLGLVPGSNYCQELPANQNALSLMVSNCPDGYAK